MVKPTDPASDTPHSPAKEGLIEVIVHSGKPTARLNENAVDPISARCRGIETLSSANGQADGATLGFKAQSRNLSLFEAKNILVKSLALWRSKQPQVRVPHLEITRSGIAAPVFRLNRPQVRRGQFRTPEVACHPIQIPPRANIATPSRWPDSPWCLPTFPLAAFPPKTRTYYRWYARERLKLEPEDPGVLGLCCPVPAMPLELLDWTGRSGGYGDLRARPKGDFDRQLEGRHGFLIREKSALTLLLVPPG